MLYLNSYFHFTIFQPLFWLFGTSYGFRHDNIVEFLNGTWQRILFLGYPISNIHLKDIGLAMTTQKSKRKISPILMQVFGLTMTTQTSKRKIPPMTPQVDCSSCGLFLSHVSKTSQIERLFGKRTVNWFPSNF